MQGRRAGLVSRFLADAIDLGVTVLVVVGVYFTVNATRFLFRPRNFEWWAPDPEFLMALGWVVLVLYLAIGWSGTGRTLGKQMMGLRLVNERGQRVRFFGALLRAVVCVLFPIGLFWCAVSRTNHSVQDIVLRTSVVYDWQLRFHPNG